MNISVRLLQNIPVFHKKYYNVNEFDYMINNAEVSFPKHGKEKLLRTHWLDNIKHCVPQENTTKCNSYITVIARSCSGAA